MRAIAFQAVEAERVIDGETITQFGDAVILVNRAAGKVVWCWDDDAPPRRRRRDHRRAVRFLRSLPPVTWPDEEGDGGLVTVIGHFAAEPEAPPKGTSEAGSAELSP